MSTKTVYMATDHGYGVFISTPQRHPLNPAHLGMADWHIARSEYSDKGVKLIWSCEITVLPGGAKPPSKFHPHAGKPKPPSKFHPHAGKKKTAKKKTAYDPSPAGFGLVKQAAPPAPKPVPAPKRPAKPRPKAKPPTTEIAPEAK